MIFILRLFTQPGIFSQLRWFAKIVPCLGLFLVSASLLFTKYQLLLYYPVIVNIAFLIIFSYSLQYPPTIIERFARIQNPDLSEKAIQYTNNVTRCWCLFFIVNGCIALITCLVGNIELWTLYNGGISYLLIALLMGGEWLIRKKYQH
ncbi:COG4648 family protein [Orbus mooreae]|uniref:COG4648 family protein n=1 Tax=Orbus mooreae TaxID=3074107 RepID=UPI00370DB8F7